MKRDFDLIRALLLEVERDSGADLSGFTEDQVKYHKALLVEAGLAEGVVKSSSRSHTEIPDAVFIRKLTWDGHEFLDQARQVTVWKRAKEHLAKQGLELTFDALKAAMKTIITSMIQ